MLIALIKIISLVIGVPAVVLCWLVKSNFGENSSRTRRGEKFTALLRGDLDGTDVEGADVPMVKYGYLCRPF